MQLNGSALNVEELDGGTSFLTLELSTALLTFVANTCQLKREVPLQPGSLDFSRQVFQIATVNNLAVAVFDFVQPGISAAEGATLSVAAWGAWVANTIQISTVNRLAAGAFDFVGQPAGLSLGTALSVATMDFVGQDIAPTHSVALNPAAFDFVGQTSTPAAVITLTTAAISFVPLDVNPANAPLGVVEGLVTASFDFAVNTISVTNSITLGAAAFGFTATEISSTTVNNLAASDLILAPQSITVTQATVQVLLTTAIFDFVPRSPQLTGTSAAGDRKRMLFGIGR